MRIKRHDISVQVYESTNTIDSEGISVPGWISSGYVSCDVQPIRSQSVLKEYGIDPGTGRICYTDLETDLPLNAVVKVGSALFQVVGNEPWYDHCEVVLKRYEGTV